MRESIDESNIMMLVIAIIFIFVAFMCLMVTFSRTIKAKNDVISIIEKYDGFGGANISSSKACEVINGYLNNRGYTAKGNVSDGGYIGINIGTECTKCTDNNCSFWIRENQLTNSYLRNYDVVLFYSLNLPIINTMSGFSVKGETVDMKVTSIGPIDG